MEHPYSTQGEEKGLQNFGRLTFGKISIWRSKRRWEENIQFDLKETECADADLDSTDSG
jgi:hypothetical protein